MSNRFPHVIFCLIWAAWTCVGSVLLPPTLDAIKTCTADNWGMPHQKRHPYRSTYQTQIQQACKAQLHKDKMRPIAHVLENATVNHYLNNKDFDAFKGIDLVPDNHNLYTIGGMWGSNLEYKHVRRDYMRAATCETDQEDGSTWTVTRIGPMRTRVSDFRLFNSRLSVIVTQPITLI
jgi:hypothetical protein